MRTLVAALSIVLLLAGCSGEGNRDDDPATPSDETSTRVDLTDQGSFEPDGLFTVAPQYAERTVDQLDVVVELTAQDVALTVGTKRAVYIAGADLVKADEAADITIEPGQTASFPLSFAGESLPTDGQVTFEVSVGGQPPTSVGFGLAD